MFALSSLEDLEPRPGLPRRSGLARSGSRCGPGLDLRLAQAAEEARPHPSKQVQALYRELAQVEDEFGAILERLSTGEVAADEELVRLGERLQVGAHQCVETEGCDPLRFFDVMGRLVEEQNVTLADQASQLEALSNEGDKIDEDLSLEAGAPSLLNAMPELGDTVALLRGNDLREMISLNGPVKAALDDWLTWNRPMLMSSYEYYQYLRDKIAPIYEEAGLPEALLFAMIATETGGRVHSFSHAGAAGLLQFIRSTGQRYGLREVDGFDMRLDPEAATRANVAYINEQFEILNESFEMTLAAYNGGESRMKRLTSVSSLCAWRGRTRRGDIRACGAHSRTLGHELGRNTIKRILADHGIAPAPERGKSMSWSTFLKAVVSKNTNELKIGSRGRFGIDVYTLGWPMGARILGHENAGSRSCISRSFAALASTKPRDTDELDRPIAPGTNSAADS